MVEDRAESRAVISLLYIKQRAREPDRRQRHRERESRVAGGWLQRCCQVDRYTVAKVCGRPVYGSNQRHSHYEALSVALIEVSTELLTALVDALSYN